MRIHNVAKLYSKALFSLSIPKEQLQNRLVVLEEIVKALNRYPNIIPYFSSLHISQKEKGMVMETALKPYIDPYLIKFFMVLLEKRRFQYLPEIVKEYRLRVIKELGILEGRLITPSELSKDIVEKLENELSKRYNKKVELEQTTDPELIGGGVLLLGNKLVDFSIKGKLERLKNDLTAISI